MTRRRFGRSSFIAPVLGALVLALGTAPVIAADPTTTTSTTTTRPAAAATTTSTTTTTRPAATAPTTTAPPDDPYFPESVRTAALGRDVMVMIGNRLAVQQAAENQAKANLDKEINDAVWKQRARQSLLEKMAVAGSDLIVTRKDYKRHGSDLVDLLQGSLMNTAGGAQLLTLSPTDATQRFYDEALYERAAAFLQQQMQIESDRIDHLQDVINQARVQLFVTDKQIAESQKRVDDARAVYNTTKSTREATEALEKKVGTNYLFPGTDINFIALDAYLRAARRITAENPDCGIQWWAIAAVGAVESGHARGRAISSDGTVVDLIVGPRLDGTDGNQTVVDTDKGKYDEDDQFDHGVGPMQFIPETWKNRGADGNYDGVKDPQNLYDAALTAGRMLCNDRGKDILSSDAGFAAAVFAYNASSDYVKKVTDAATRYRNADLLPSRVISVVLGGGLTATTSEFVRQLTSAGWVAKTIAGGDVAKIEHTLNPPPTTTVPPSTTAPTSTAPATTSPPPPPAHDGIFLVVPDASWSTDDQLRVLNGVGQASGGLRVAWVPTAGAAAPALRDAITQAGNVQLLAPAPPPKSVWCGNQDACPLWRSWFGAVLGQLG